MEIREYLLTKKEDIKSIEVKERLKDINENKNFIISIIGPRRAGKTYFLYNFIKKKKIER
jgi:predicted AAA+ superfamily ATPase